MYFKWFWCLDSMHFIILDKSESSPTTSAEYQPSKKPRLSADSETEPSPSSSPKEESKKEELLMPTSPARLAEVIRKSATTLVSLLQGSSNS